MKYFLKLLGNPETAFKCVHIAGTSGKGTTTDLVHEMLRAAGKKVGSFTSPSVVAAIEKIKVDDLYISPDDFAGILEELKPLIDRAYATSPYGGPSSFEILLAMAFVYFKKQKCEYAVLEVGLGGRYDATNIINRPLVTAVTMIDYDHTEILGKTLSKIAYDKAGIIKPGSQFFTAETRPAILKIFKDICIKVKADFHQIKPGDNYRKKNIDLASAIARALGLKETQIVSGIKKSRLPCRFEIVSAKPLVILDGAHNPSKMAATKTEVLRRRFKRLFLIIGMANDKDKKGVLKNIIPVSDHVYVTRFQNPERKGAPPLELSRLARQFLKSKALVSTYIDPNMALQTALKKARANDMILVTGSFFLSGELRRFWRSEESVLRRRKNVCLMPEA